MVLDPFEEVDRPRIRVVVRTSPKMEPANVVDSLARRAIGTWDEDHLDVTESHS